MNPSLLTQQLDYLKLPFIKTQYDPLAQQATRTAIRNCPFRSKNQPAIFSVFFRTSVFSPVEIFSLYRSCQALSRSLIPIYSVSGSLFGALYWSTRTPFSPVRSREAGAWAPAAGVAAGSTAYKL